MPEPLPEHAMKAARIAGENIIAQNPHITYNDWLDARFMAFLAALTADDLARACPGPVAELQARALDSAANAVSSLMARWLRVRAAALRSTDTTER